MKTLYLGHCDTGSIPQNTLSYLSTYHNVQGVLKNRISFREDDRKKWRRFKELPGSTVKDLQTFLFNAGFMPKSDRNGIFGYATQASVRLFQEYIRTKEGMTDCHPDGYVGSDTWKHIQRWKDNNLTCHWQDNIFSTEYSKWISVLEKGKNHYVQHESELLNQVKNFPRKSDSISVNNWEFNSNDIHLIGIRSNENVRRNIRDNDDLFILLIHGKVFKFYGSTDPNQSVGSRPDEPFIVEGQHKYRFGWHKISNEQKVYRALRPYQHGVLTFRDKNNDNALNEIDIQAGLDSNPNKTINIHWTGTGVSNFSAGCQVIAGSSYINDEDNLIDCTDFAARTYSQFNSTDKKTKAAYNVFTDLILSYAAPGKDFLFYTLGRDENLTMAGNFGEAFLSQHIKRLKSVL